MSVRILLPRAWLLVALVLLGCTERPSESARGRLEISEVLGERAVETPDESAFDYAEVVVPFEFPRDHGPHPSFRSEWWYLTVVLETHEGRTFGVQFTLFRQALVPCLSPSCDGWRSGQIFLGHVGLADVEAETHREWERISRGHPALAGVRLKPFEAFIEDWRLSADEVFETYQLEVPLGSEGSIELTMSVEQPITLQGDRGLSYKGGDNASYYYSIPRLAAEGSISINGDRYAVEGLGWLDREWSTSVLAEEFVGWDWFALHLDDGRNVMAFQLRRRDGAASEYNAGSAIAANGESASLTTDDLAFAVLETWQGWPVAWTIEVQDDVWRIEAAFEDQVMNTSIRYWEGVVDVYDEDGRRLGRGYLEMTGYAP